MYSSLKLNEKMPGKPYGSLCLITDQVRMQYATAAVVSYGLLSKLCLHTWKKDGSCFELDWMINKNKVNDNDNKW